MNHSTDDGSLLAHPQTNTQFSADTLNGGQFKVANGSPGKVMEFVSSTTLAVVAAWPLIGRGNAKEKLNAK